MSNTHTHGALTTKMLDLLEEIEYRRIDSIEDLEAVARLRRKAYEPVGMAPANNSLMIDDEDFAENAHVIGVYHMEKLVATMRLHHLTARCHDGLAMRQFPDVIGPMLDMGLSFIDPLKFAADPVYIRDVPGLAYLTIRTALMASDYYNTDYCLAVIKPNHRAFYKRFLGFSALSEPSYCEYLDCDLDIYGGKIKQTLPQICKKYPFFGSSKFEQRQMFAPLNQINFPPLCIKPQISSLKMGL